MKIVVLGATGNVGTALLRRLHAAPEVTQIVGVSREGPERGGEPYDGVEWHTVDVAEKESTGRLAEILRGADLSGADLRRAVLKGADLSRAVMHGAQVKQADFTGAQTGGARGLDPADLKAAAA